MRLDITEWRARLTPLLLGDREPPTYLLSRWVFLRLLGLVYLIAFVSLAVQVIGLVGERGILPVAEFLDRAQLTYGLEAYRLWPTLLWLTASDTMLRFLAWGGALLAVLVVAGVAQMPVATLLWAFYLSLTVAGQTFLSFQWDILLLETGLLGILYAPTGWGASLANEPLPSPVMRWLVWLLLFKLLFLSGATKLLSGDPTWRDLTALTYHYETQPLPTLAAWYVHHLPVWFHKLEILGMYAVELAVPFVVFTPPRFIMLRRLGCIVLVLFQFGIALTGNYGFFNVITIVLCLTLLDDHVLKRVVPRVLSERAELGGRRREPPLKRRAVAVFASVIVVISTLTFAREMIVTVPGARSLGSINALIGFVQPFHSVNGYGLFRVMTTQRPEIVIEGSSDGEEWREYGFRWKPVDLDRSPRFNAPHQPRLDWQMWFAALSPSGNQRWLAPLMLRMLEGEPTVMRLLKESPFPDELPTYVRLVYYQYHFSTWAERKETGAWWRREFVGYLTEPVSLRDF